MRKLFLYAFVCFYCISNAQNSTFKWAKLISGAYEDAASDILVDGNYIYSTGFFSGSSQMPVSGGCDAYVFKLTLNGAMVWARTFGGPNSDYGRAICIDANQNLITIGEFDGVADLDPGTGTYNATSAGFSDVFITKLDPSGNLVWARNIGGLSSDTGRDIQVDSLGNVYITGNFTGAVDFDPGMGSFVLNGNYDAYILKLNANGDFIWAVKVGGESHSLHVDKFVYVTGFFAGTADFDPSASVFNLNSNGGSSDVFVIKIDTAGNFKWARAMGGPGQDEGASLKVDKCLNVYLTGYYENSADFDPSPASYSLTSSGNRDVFHCKLDSLGSFIWAKSYGDSFSSDYACSITLDDQNNIYTTGGEGINISFISKHDSLGSLIWEETIYCDYYIGSWSIGIDQFSNVYTTGPLDGKAYFYKNIWDATSTINSYAQGDIYIHKFFCQPVGLSENTKTNNPAFAYPNPAADKFIIDLPAQSSISITDLLGKELFHSKDLSSGKHIIDVGNYPKGIYLIDITSNNAHKTFKLVKE